MQHNTEKMSDRLCRNVGFTLVESIVTIVIFSFIAGGIYATLLAGDSSWHINSIQIELQQELRKAMSGMRDDLWQSGRAAITDVPADGAWYSTITFYKAAGVSGGKISWSSDTTQFLLGGTNMDQLQRIEDLTTKVMAQSISSLQFRRLATAPDIVEVALQAEKDTFKGGTMSDTLNFKIHLRN
jgi:prepilin-type N-terminal cleavage/methylation domain-containing protein